MALVRLSKKMGVSMKASSRKEKKKAQENIHGQIDVIIKVVG